jgi:hypothetical protein
VFAVHLHNQWEKNFPPGGWVERLLLRRYEKKLAGDGWQAQTWSNLLVHSVLFD